MSSLLLMGCGVAAAVASDDMDAPTGATFYDKFIDADDTSLTAHTPNIGSSWWSVTSGTQKISGNAALVTDDFLFAMGAAGADYLVRAKLGLIGTDAFASRIYLIGRWGAPLDNSGNFYYLSYYESFGSISVEIGKYLSGVQTTLDNAYTVTSRPDIIELNMVGTTIVGKIDGVQRYSATDASLATGRVGIYGSGPVAGSMITFKTFAAAPITGGGGK